jgi:hypothetical protein
MIVSFQLPTVGMVTPSPIVLARGLAYRESPGDIREGQRRLTQRDANVRASTKTPRDRGNREITYAFRIRRQFTTLALAETFARDHFPALDSPAGGATLICQTEDSGGITFTRTLNDAVCEDVQYQHDGIAIYVSYNFLGSYWS